MKNPIRSKQHKYIVRISISQDWLMRFITRKD